MGVILNAFLLMLMFCALCLCSPVSRGLSKDKDMEENQENCTYGRFQNYEDDQELVSCCPYDGLKILSHESFERIFAFCYDAVITYFKCPQNKVFYQQNTSCIDSFNYVNDNYVSSYLIEKTPQELIDKIMANPYFEMPVLVIESDKLPYYKIVNITNKAESFKAKNYQDDFLKTDLKYYDNVYNLGDGRNFFRKIHRNFEDRINSKLVDSSSMNSSVNMANAIFKIPSSIRTNLNTNKRFHNSISSRPAFDENRPVGSVSRTNRPQLPNNSNETIINYTSEIFQAEDKNHTSLVSEALGSNDDEEVVTSELSERRVKIGGLQQEGLSSIFIGEKSSKENNYDTYIKMRDKLKSMEATSKIKNDNLEEDNFIVEAKVEYLGPSNSEIGRVKKGNSSKPVNEVLEKSSTITPFHKVVENMSTPLDQFTEHRDINKSFDEVEGQRGNSYQVDVFEGNIASNPLDEVVEKRNNSNQVNVNVGDNRTSKPVDIELGVKNRNNSNQVDVNMVNNKTSKATDEVVEKSCNSYQVDVTVGNNITRNTVDEVVEKNIIKKPVIEISSPKLTTTPYYKTDLLNFSLEEKKLYDEFLSRHFLLFLQRFIKDKSINIENDTISPKIQIIADIATNNKRVCNCNVEQEENKSGFQKTDKGSFKKEDNVSIGKNNEVIIPFTEKNIIINSKNESFGLILEKRINTVNTSQQNLLFDERVDESRSFITNNTISQKKKSNINIQDQKTFVAGNKSQTTSHIDKTIEGATTHRPIGNNHTPHVNNDNTVDIQEENKYQTTSLVEETIEETTTLIRKNHTENDGSNVNIQEENKYKTSSSVKKTIEETTPLIGKNHTENENIESNVRIQEENNLDTDDKNQTIVSGNEIEEKTGSLIRKGSTLNESKEISDDIVKESLKYLKNILENNHHFSQQQIDYIMDQAKYGKVYLKSLTQRKKECYITYYDNVPEQVEVFYSIFIERDDEDSSQNLTNSIEPINENKTQEEEFISKINLMGSYYLGNNGKSSCDDNSYQE